MRRRAFIKGMIAAGVLITMPLESAFKALRPRYITAMDVLRQNKEWEDMMKKELSNLMLFGTTHPEVYEGR